jgi:6,7-dimethyl-8-ribityllumazine synthase
MKNWRVGVVTSRFNEEVTGRLREGALDNLKKLGLKDKQIHSVTVPGAYEIPLAAKWLLDNKCDGVIALGAVIRGETTHYDYVCSSVERGCTQLQLKTGKPVVFGVLTTENDEQAINRAGGRHGHKGVEAAQVLVEMLNLKKTIKNPKKTRSKK